MFCAKSPDVAENAEHNFCDTAKNCKERHKRGIRGAEFAESRGETGQNPPTPVIFVNTVDKELRGRIRVKATAKGLTVTFSLKNEIGNGKWRDRAAKK